MESALIISNTTPLINFAQIGRMDVLASLFGRITIPPAVVDELGAKAELFPAAAQVPMMNGISVMAPADRLLVRVLASRVHRGEAECLSLAMEPPDSMLLLDDLAARELATSNHLLFTGTLGCLVQAKPRASSPRSSPCWMSCAARHASGFPKPWKPASCAMLGRIETIRTHRKRQESRRERHSNSALCGVPISRDENVRFIPAIAQVCVQCQTSCMSDTDTLFHDSLPLADKIAGGYANIPGMTADDVQAVAHAALHRAAMTFDSARGEFQPYAARAIRNALNSLHQKEVRHAQLHLPEADMAGASSTESSTAPSQQLPDEFQDVLIQVRSQESRHVLEKLLASLPARTQQILALVAEGHSYAEIGERLGVSKQAVHKTAAGALDSLRKQLAVQGFVGLDSKGFLQTATYQL